jgi:hypothetical protein
LINPKAYRVFTLLVSDSQSGKATLVEKLDRTLQQYKNNRLPLRVPPATKLLKVADELAQVLPTDEDPALGTRPYLLPEPLLIRVGQLNTEFDAGSAAVDTTLWSEETFNEIRSYLENSKPREQLAEIRASAEDLRKSIEAVFPLSDILWKVGSKSFRDEYGYDRSAITRE